METPFQEGVFAKENKISLTQVYEIGYHVPRKLVNCRWRESRWKCGDLRYKKQRRQDGDGLLLRREWQLAGFRGSSHSAFFVSSFLLDSLP